MLFLILLSATVLGISFSCSMAEAVLLSLNPLRLKLDEKRGSSDAKRWLLLKNRIERPISAILVLNTLANTGMATLSGAVFSSLYGAEWLWAYSVLMTVAVLFGGELAPKILGVHHAEQIAPLIIGPLSVVMRVCEPFVRLMDVFCEKLKRGGNVRGQSDQIMDIITLVQAARAEQLLHSREEIIIIHAATLSARRVKTAMVPWEGVRVFDERLTLEENVRAVGGKLHRSYPVSADGTLNKMTGYVRVRELFVSRLLEKTENDGLAWRRLVRPALHIDGKASLTQLLALFLEKQEVAALVDSRESGLIGWVTMDDVMKVLMGARI
jgi:CBS domain containing-hemolysin-like protein